MTDKKNAENIFDKIRSDADEKRTVKMAEKKRNDEFFARMKNGNNPLDEINQILKGEKNNEYSN
jgi:hypothetical protein